MRRLISSDSPYEAILGYSRAVVQGDWCFVSGSTGADPLTREIPESLEDQARNTMTTIGAALEQAGFTLNDVVRATYYLTSRDDIERVTPMLGEMFRAIRPAATMLLVSGLIHPRMKIEIEVTAFRG
ncbi:MAG: RidA family protein [Defluviimonas sp.]|nr:RidA family protein [Defluviimonas sp.]